MSLTLTIILSLFSAGILAGRAYEILNLTDTATGFLMAGGIVFNPYIPGLFAVITLCCGILIFGSCKTVKPYYSNSSKYTAFLAGAAFVAAGALSFKQGMLDLFFIAGGLALIVMTFTGLGKKKTDILVMLLLLGFAAGMCMDVVSFDVSTYYNTVFLQNVLEYLCIIAFMLMVVKNVYLPSKNSRMMLYVTGMLSFAVCSMMNIADIICYVLTGGQNINQLVMYIAPALFGIYAFDTAVSAIPTKKELKDTSKEKHQHETEKCEETVANKTETEAPKQLTAVLPCEETAGVNSETTAENQAVEVSENETEDISVQSELEHIFDMLAEEKAENTQHLQQEENTYIDTEFVSEEKTEKDASKYDMFSELFGEKAETEIEAEETQNILSENRSFKKFSQPKLEESAPEYDMLKSMFRGEDTSQYQFDYEETDKKQTGNNKESKKKRSIFGGAKKEKATEEKVKKAKVKTEESVEKKAETKPKTVLEEKAETGKTKFVAAEPKISATKAETKKIVYKKPK